MYGSPVKLHVYNNVHDVVYKYNVFTKLLINQFHRSS